MAQLKDMQTGASGDAFTFTSLVATTADINGGTVDGAVIGGASAAAGTFTSLTDSGNLTFTGTGNRILGDFSNATIANRVAFQSSTVNATTFVSLLPNGTGTTSSINCFGVNDPTNTSFLRLLQNGTADSQIRSDITGTGTYASMSFHTGGSERVRIDTFGNVGIGTGTVSTIRFRVASAADWIMIGRNAANSSDVFGIAESGNVLNTNNSYGALSDIKLKENIVAASPKLDKLMQVEIVNYNRKDNPEQKLIGVVAQQLEQVFPSLVEESTDRDEEGNDLGTTTKSVKYSVFVPMLIKAMQEQQSLIQDLTTRLTTLEGN
jgi:hypothetical protein